MIKALRTTLNEILALAVLELFPGTLLGDGRVTATQFSYQFRFLQPKHPELLPLLEEKMRAILKTDPLIERIEMAANSAENYFDHHGQPHKADRVAESGETILPLIRIGSFCDLISTTASLSLPPLAFKLLEVKEGEEWMEIVGTAFPSKEELKAFIKKRKSWLKQKPWEGAERKGWITTVEGEVVLLPDGVKKRNELEQVWRSQIQKQGLLEVFTGNSHYLPLLFRQLKQGIAEWGIDSDLSIVPSKDLCISSLQFIHQTFSMLELNGKWVVGTEWPGGTVRPKKWEHQVNSLIKALEECGFPFSIDPDSCRAHPTIEFRIVDSIGEEWPGPFLSYEGEASLMYSCFGPIKRLMALLGELRP